MYVHLARMYVVRQNFIASLTCPPRGPVSRALISSVCSTAPQRFLHLHLSSTTLPAPTSHFSTNQINHTSNTTCTLSNFSSSPSQAPSSPPPSAQAVLSPPSTPPPPTSHGTSPACSKASATKSPSGPTTRSTGTARRSSPRTGTTHLTSRCSTYISKTYVRSFPSPPRSKNHQTADPGQTAVLPPLDNVHAPQLLLPRRHPRSHHRPHPRHHAAIHPTRRRPAICVCHHPQAKYMDARRQRRDPGKRKPARRPRHERDGTGQVGHAKRERVLWYVRSSPAHSFRLAVCERRQRCWR